LNAPQHQPALASGISLSILTPVPPELPVLIGRLELDEGQLFARDKYEIHKVARESDAAVIAYDPADEVIEDDNKEEDDE